MVVIEHYYFPLKKQYNSNKGLSERLTKQRHERAGWKVWRGGFIHAPEKSELYPNVERKYIQLKSLLLKIGMYETFCYFSRVQKGMPDFIMEREGQIKFVECKLGHEQLSTRQKRCIEKIHKYGFRVEVHKHVFSCTKRRKALVNIWNQEAEVQEKQLRLTKKLCQRH